MREFYLTSTTTITAENKMEADSLWDQAKQNPNSWILNDLIKNAQIDEGNKID